jgi:protein O-mannosyl-transferase
MKKSRRLTPNLKVATERRPAPAAKAVSANVRSDAALWISGMLIALTIIVYFPVGHFEFVSFDDPQYVKNPVVARGLTWDGIVWAVSDGHAGNWHPVTWLSHMLDVQFYGLKAGPQHVMNLVLHVANLILLFALLYRTTGALLPTTLAAGLFALHPLHVESVAWVAERKDVLSMFFGLLTIWAYVREVRNSRTSRFPLVIGLFLLGLASKPMLVTLPFVLLLLDVWPLRRLEWPPAFKDVKPLVWEKFPLFALSAVSSVVTFIVQQRDGSMKTLARVPFIFRIENAALAYVSYLTKMVWPSGLVVLYPYPQSISMWAVIGATLFLVAVSVATVAYAKRLPYLLVGWFWYLGTLIPVIGLVQVGSQPMADRYSYLSSVGISIIAAWGLWDLLQRVSMRTTVYASIAGTILIAAAIVTVAQIQYWANSVVLWRHAVEVTKANPLAYNNLAGAFNDVKRPDEAIEEYETALRLKPDYAEAHFSLANTLMGVNRVDEALQHYAAALRTTSDPGPMNNEIGVVLANNGRTSDAIERFSEALRIEPNLAVAHSNRALARKKLGLALAKEGKSAEAANQLTAALVDQPADAEIHNNLGVVLANEGKIHEAIEHFSEAVRLKPDFTDARNNLARASNATP